MYISYILLEYGRRIKRKQTPTRSSFSQELFIILKTIQNQNHSILLPEYEQTPYEITESKKSIIEYYFKDKKYLEFNICAAKGLDLIKKYDKSYGNSSQAGGSDNITIEDVNKKMFGNDKITLDQFKADIKVEFPGENYKKIVIKEGESEVNESDFDTAVENVKKLGFGRFKSNYKDHIKLYMTYKPDSKPIQQGEKIIGTNLAAMRMKEDLIEQSITKIKLLDIYRKLSKVRPDKINKIKEHFTIEVNNLKVKVEEIVNQMKQKEKERLTLIK